MMCDALPKVSRLSRLFQLSNIYLAELHSHVQTTMDGLNSHSGENFSQLDSDLASILAPYNIPHSPEATSRFFDHIQKPFLHALVENINKRLPDTDVFTNFEIFNPLKLPDTVEDTCSEKYGEMQVEKLGEKYGLGDSPIISCDDLKLEWLDFRIYMLSSCSKKTVKDILSSLATQGSTTAAAYPNLSKLAQICLVLPVGTADCERGFSTMKRIKTRLRSQMTNVTLNHCMRVSMEGQAFDKFDLETAVNSWSLLKNRRIV